jgi:NFU1 iron-sulfur cluster scaffold homolog, mitochondrial
MDQQSTNINPQDIKIVGEPSEFHPQQCKFTIDREVYAGTARVTSKEKAEGAPLAARLFALGFVTQVAFSGREVTVTKNDESEWEKIGKQVGSAIRAHIASGEPAVREGAQLEDPATAELRERVQQVIDELINPGVAGHGGFVNLVDIEGTKVYIHMGGGCQGCSSSKMTLRMGIESTIKEEVPEITEIIDATDHASGQTPY